MKDINLAIANTREHLLSLRNAAGHWEGELSSSALSTATAIVALSLVDAEKHEKRIGEGAYWLIEYQNADGGWGDTSISKSNLSTTLLCWSALSLVGTRCVVSQESDAAVERCEEWIREQVGSLEPEAICKAVIGRYGKDKTFSVPILMTCAMGGRLGEHAWKRVLPLPFELAAFPRTWFGAIGLPVVSYALPALIAIGYARFFHEPPKWWNPLRWMRGLLWSRISPMLKTLQPSTGGYLEATPLTSFVTMALASADEKYHPCVPAAVEFLEGSQRKDGSWPIDTNLATWATTLSVKALYGSADTLVHKGTQFGDEAAKNDEADKLRSREANVRAPLMKWLLAQQYREVHPFTNAAPGGWAWTDLPGGVPDADDTSSALIALWHLAESEEERRQLVPSVEDGITWLLDLQNRDGGMPTFCRGWGTLPFDRSTPEITAHALWAFSLWENIISDDVASRVGKSKRRGLAYLKQVGAITEGRYFKQKFGNAKRALSLVPYFSWDPLWFGNENTPLESNPVFGTAAVLNSLNQIDGQIEEDLAGAGYRFLMGAQHVSGGWGADREIEATIEETSMAIIALAGFDEMTARFSTTQRALPIKDKMKSLHDGVSWILEATQNGTVFPAAPIGLYFARLWYHEKMYPVIWTLSALEHAKQALAKD